MITVSHSMIRTFKECRRKYFFSYVEGLKPVETADVLKVGSSYHEKIESIIKTGGFDYTNDKTDAMALAWMRYIYPKLDLVEAEQRFEYELHIDNLPPVRVVGYVDGICRDGLQVEHKTTTAAIDDEYIHSLAWDEQIPIYLLSTWEAGKETNNCEMWYTVCRKPTIRQRQNETEEEYVQRCIEWYDEDTEQKISMFKVRRSVSELAERQREIAEIAQEIDSCKNFYPNPYACQILGCPYSSICLNYDPKFIIGFEKHEREGERQNGVD